MFTRVTDNLAFSYASLLISYYLQRILFHSHSETSKKKKNFKRAVKGIETDTKRSVALLK